MLKCAILDDYQGCALEMANWNELPDLSVTSIREYLPSFAARIERLTEFDVIVAMRERTPFDAALLKSLPKLKLLVTTGSHNASIDLSAAAQQQITVCGTRGLAYPPAELTWGLLLAVARNISTEVSAVHNGRWQETIGIGLSGKTIGVVGLGSVGAQVARYALAFGMRVIAWSPSLSQEKAEAAGVERVNTLETLLRTADVVSIHAKLTDDTHGLLGANQLALMKPSAVLVNTSRGPIVDEAALIDVLSKGRIAGAALDVYNQEPLPPNHPFRMLPNVVATPHVGYVTTENYELFYRDALEDIAAWHSGNPVRQL